MAADITLLKSFVDGQGAGASTYIAYPTDLDSNFTTLETQFNQLNSEVKAFAGQNSQLVVDLIQSDTPLVSTGFVGAGSFPTAFLTTTVANDTLQIGVGVAFTSSGRVAHNTVDAFVGSGASGSRFFAMTANGIVSQETSAAQAVLDLYEVNWNGTSFDTATLTRLPTGAGHGVIPDGNDFQNSKIQENIGQGTDAVIEAFTYDEIHERIDDVVRIMSGMASGGTRASASAAHPTTLKPMALGGAIATPGLILGDGTNYNTNSGLFGNPNAVDASASWGIVLNGDALLTFVENSAEGQTLVRNGTALANPPLAWEGDVDSGFRWVSADVFEAVVGGLAAFRFTETALDPQVSFVGNPAGDSSVPGLTPIGDLDTGLMSDAADSLQILTGGTEAMDISSLQQISADSQFRLHVTTTAELIGTGTTYIAISMDTEVTDIGGWGTAPTALWTVPTGGDGFYMITGSVLIDESVGANAGTLRDLAIEINGSPALSGRDERAPRGSGTVDNALCVSHGLELVATNTIELSVRQDSGSSENVDATLSIVRLW